MFCSSAPAIANDENQKNYGISVDNPLNNPSRLIVRKFLNETTVIYSGIGLRFSSDEITRNDSFSTINSTSNGDNYSLAFGTRTWFSRDNLSTFLDLELDGSYFKGRGSNSSSHFSTITLTPTYGLEYHLLPNVSIEGRAGIELGFIKNSSNNYSGLQQFTTKSTHKFAQFPILVTAITYYW